MSSGYENAPATKMLATNCAVCGKPLVDAESCETGLGPICRAESGFDAGVADADREAANRLVFSAAIAAQQGRATVVVKIAKAVEKLGFPVLAEKMRARFVNVVAAPERRADIFIEVEKDGKVYSVKTPYRRGAAEEFKSAWRTIPGRRYYGGVNHIPVEQKPALWALLKQFFPGKWGKGPQGVFRVPKEA
jgi:hypothetical protein